MSTLVGNIANIDRGYGEPAASRILDRDGWGFIALILVTAALFLRPADLVAAWDQWPIYQFLIIVCLFLSVRVISHELTFKRLLANPITTCLVLLVGAVAASHIANGSMWNARFAAWMMAKQVALYMLVAGLLSTPTRLLIYVRWLTLAIVLLAAIAILDEMQVIHIAAVESIDDSTGPARLGADHEVSRLRGTGIFHDPNDLGLVLVLGIMLAAAPMTAPGRGWHRLIWFGAIVLLGAALAQTHSRGAFLSMLASVMAWIFIRYGCWRGMLFSLAALPLLIVAFAGRMTEFHAIADGTGQSRIQIWSETSLLFQRSPMFGIGQGMMTSELGVVGHNSFLHCFAELGFLGGVVFAGTFYAAIVGLAPRREAANVSHDTGMSALFHMRPWLCAAVIGYAVGIVTLSRAFVGPTYLTLGLAAAAITHYRPFDRNPLRFTSKFVARILLLGVVLVVSFHLLIRALLRL